ncbi:MAG: ATP-dependent DNA ligase, partial [Alphaproteobacteria bacterium]
TTDRFGPLRAVSPALVFEVEYASTTPNLRRKCRLDLHHPRLIRWLPDAAPETADDLTSLQSDG